MISNKIKENKTVVAKRMGVWLGLGEEVDLKMATALI